MSIVFKNTNLLNFSNEFAGLTGRQKKEKYVESLHLYFYFFKTFSKLIEIVLEQNAKYIFIRNQFLNKFIFIFEIKISIFYFSILISFKIINELFDFISFLNLMKFSYVECIINLFPIHFFC